ncbi:hypothetical protein OG216_34740 [Streptomycetaceae bacterium NBC_01309]
MPDTPPRIDLPDCDPPLNREIAHLLLRMLTAVAAHRASRAAGRSSCDPPPDSGMGADGLEPTG